MFDRSPRISDDVDIENLDDENQSLREGNDEKNIFDGFYHEENPGQYLEDNSGQYHEMNPGKYLEESCAGTMLINSCTFRSIRRRNSRNLS